MDLTGFDANTVEPSAPYTPIPAGDYICVITSSEEKPTKAMTGSYLQLGLEIVSGPQQGRTVIDRLNLDNPNAIAVEIAQRALSAICRAVGVMTPRNASELHNKPMTVTVAVKPASGDFGASNEVKGYAPAGGTTGVAPVPTEQLPTPASASTPPWKR